MTNAAPTSDNNIYQQKAKDSYNYLKNTAALKEFLSMSKHCIFVH